MDDRDDDPANGAEPMSKAVEGCIFAMLVVSIVLILFVLTQFRDGPLLNLK